MEIFQTIWTALTSENATLTKIICSPLMFLETYISMLLFTAILKINCNKKQKTIYSIVVSLIGLFTLFFIPMPYNIFINIIACPIMIVLIFKVSILKSISAEIIPYLFFVIIGLMVSNIYLIIFNISNQCFNFVPIHKISFSLSTYIIIYGLYMIFKHFNITLNFASSFSKKNTIILFFNILIGILAITVESYISANYTDVLPTFINLSSVIILLIYFLITLFTLFNRVKLEQTTQYLEQERLYNKTLTILYDEIRGFKHDFSNIVQAIGGYVASNNINGLNSYYTDLLIDCQKANNLSVLNPELINNPAIYSLLTSKYHKADELGIKTNMEVVLDLSTINMKPYELSRVLGILLDNAIEASSQTTEKTINVFFRKDSKTNRQLIIIQNSYLNKEVDTDKIFQKGYTSKTVDDKSHGLGLWEVRQILKRHNNLNLFTTKNNKFFTQQLEIY